MGKSIKASFSIIKGIEYSFFWSTSSGGCYDSLLHEKEFNIGCNLRLLMHYIDVLHEEIAPDFKNLLLSSDRGNYTEQNDFNTTIMAFKSLESLRHSEA